jgi:hypothetical protein
VTVDELLGAIIEPARHVGDAFSIKITPGVEAPAAVVVEAVPTGPIKLPEVCD